MFCQCLRQTAVIVHTTSGTILLYLNHLLSSHQLILFDLYQGPCSGVESATSLLSSEYILFNSLIQFLVIQSITN